MKEGHGQPDSDHHFNTDALRSDLTGKSVRSAFVKLGSRAIRFVIALGSAMVLARILDPEDFGLLAMVASLTLFVSAIKEFGLPMATVHQQELDTSQLSRLFWLTCKLNVATSVCMALLAPLLAWFYSEPRLILITMATACSLLLPGLALQHESLLLRQMRFGLLTFIDVSAMMLGATVSIGMALAGAGYWALVLQFAVHMGSRTGLIWMCCKWRPARPAESGTGSIRTLVSYGGFLTGHSILVRIGSSIDRILVGYLAGAQVLGLYAAAYRWAHFPIQQMQAPLSDVAVAGFSRIQDQAQAFRASCRKGFLPIFALIVPSLAFLSLEGNRAVLILLGEKWVDAIPLFRIFCLAGFCSSITHVTRWLYLSEGHTKRQLKWGFVRTPVMLAAAALGARWGAMGIAIAVTSAACVLVYPSLWYCLRRSHFSLSDFHAILWRPLFATAVAAAALMILRPLFILSESILRGFILHGACFGVVYMLAWLAIPGGWGAASGMLSLLRQVRPGSPLGTGTDDIKEPDGIC